MRAQSWAFGQDRLPFSENGCAQIDACPITSRLIGILINTHGPIVVVRAHHTRHKLSDTLGGFYWNGRQSTNLEIIRLLKRCSQGPLVLLGSFYDCNGGIVARVTSVWRFVWDIRCATNFCGKLLWYCLSYLHIYQPDKTKGFGTLESTSNVSQEK